ncbi:alpha/beta fold hydrolase [Pseudomonas sp. UBA6323]|uniref:alpha/beta fold hydrolase n=1 Tax=Pseudomonas sp. UBA6323 TaxID=1947329 RepID=UPI0025E63208|nr:alpha/beta hydrolase [Pseudomonas sp. UBA6323]
MHTESIVSGIPVYIDGESPDIIVMLHGWPDSHEIWARQVQHFKRTHRCVRFTLPGFDDPKTRGFSISEITGLILRVVNQVSPNGRVTLMLHDWGCLFGFHFAATHPHKVARIVAVDVGDASSPAFKRGLSLRAKWMIFAYQMPLALTWYLQGPVGDYLARATAKYLRCKTDPASIHAGMSYPYAMRWMGARGGLKNLMGPTQLACPIFYAYGSYKPFQFQSEQWLQTLSTSPGCKVVLFKSSHWVMVDCAEGFNRAVSDWLAPQECEGPSSPSAAWPSH